MKSIIALVIILTVGLLILGGVRNYVEAPEQVACTMEAMLCPDGSYVGRTGPNCEFAPCPSPTATTTGGAGIVPFNSGVNGLIMVGPTCPVVQYPPAGECDDRPLSTLVAIFRASDTVHAHVLTRSDGDGKFSASLAPGEYVIGAGEKQMPSCPQTNITVLPNKYVSITINCDSGIR